MERKDLITVFLKLDFPIFALIILTSDFYNDKKRLNNSTEKDSCKNLLCYMPAVGKKRSETVEEIRLYQSTNSPNETMINKVFHVIH